MLKIAIIGALITSSSLLQAEDAFSVEVGSKIVSSSKNKFLGIQELSEIVGKDGQENFIEGYYQIDKYKFGVRYTNISKFDENKLEVIGKVKIPSSFTNLSYNLGFGVGFGEQKKKRKTISTDMTASKYIISSELSKHYVNTEIYTKELNYFLISVQAGINYKITNNLSINAGIESENKYWNIQYKLINSNENVSLAGLGQRSIKTYASIEHKF